MGNGKKYRLAAVKEAPVYHPTAAEFADPLRYIASIRGEAEQYGLCRIVPPSSYKVPFNQAPSTFSFKTRIQTVTELQLRLKKGKNRNFRTEYADFMQSQGSSVTRWPVFGGKKLDLEKLYDNVSSRGGFDVACRSKQWRDVARVLDTPATVTSASFALRQLYQKWLLAFEQHKKTQETLSPAGKAASAAASKKEKESKEKEREREKAESAAAKEKAASQASVKEEDLLEALFELGNVSDPAPKRQKLEMVRHARLPPPPDSTLSHFIFSFTPSAL
jgi:histone demethylase JARID1